MIKPIILGKTENTPEVILDKENSVFQISGRSIVENAHEFYAPILSWLKEYFKNPNNSTELVLNLDYLNSSSSLQIMKMIFLFEHNKNDSINLKITWKYDSEDEMSKERGEELMHSTSIKFELEGFENEEFEEFDFQF
ncbi:MAG: DUF1987 domain-containing protein [Bacteroidales bacterium]|nr:DUF1987 domain-containing protein [Bacteroidales bacterium]